jgi:hypothetical protein
MSDAPITTVYAAGQVCLGFVLNRGLGLFPTQREAAAAIMRGQP